MWMKKTLVTCTYSFEERSYFYNFCTGTDQAQVHVNQFNKCKAARNKRETYYIIMYCIQYCHCRLCKFIQQSSRDEIEEALAGKLHQYLTQ